MMKKVFFVVTLFLVMFSGYTQLPKDSFYYRRIAEPGVKFIPVENGKYKVFTQKKGKGKIKLLLLHGGPANTHEYMEHFPEHLNKEGVTIYFYDQLGSYYSDQPNDSSIWRSQRFADEVEEVRKGLGLKNFYILGHSWGALLGQIYAAKYPKNLKGLILSNPPVFLKDTAKVRLHYKEFWNKAYDTILAGPEFANLTITEKDSLRNFSQILDTVKYGRYQDLLGMKLYRKYQFRGDTEPQSMTKNSLHINRTGQQALKDWRIQPYWEYDAGITCPVLLLGGQYDRMGQRLYPEMANQFSNTKVRLYLCPNGSHFSMWDDTKNYFTALISFIKDVENKKF